MSPPPTPDSALPKLAFDFRLKTISDPKYEFFEGYRPGGYHPVHLGDILNSRYRVLNKLGAGSFSTVWLALDERCLVLEAMGPSVSVMTEAYVPKNSMDGILLLWATKEVARQMLQAIGQLYDADIIHSDIQFGNILFSEPKPDEMEGFEPVDQVRKLNPDNHVLLERLDGKADKWSPRYLVAPLTIPRDYRLPLRFRIKLSDFGSAFYASARPEKIVTPLGLRSPEQLLELPLTGAVDIWSFLFQMLACEPLFFISTFFMSPEQATDEHLIQIINTLGPISQEMRGKWTAYSMSFKDDGEPLEEDAYPTLEKRLQKRRTSEGDYAHNKRPILAVDGNELQQLLSFLKRALCTDPSKRASAAELLQDPWLASDVSNGE